MTIPIQAKAIQTPLVFHHPVCLTLSNVEAARATQKQADRE